MKRVPKTIKTEYVIRRGEVVVDVKDTLAEARRKLEEVDASASTQGIQIVKQSVVETILDVYEPKSIVAWSVLEYAGNIEQQNSEEK